MIPIKDQIPTRRVPVVNYILILANLIVFAWQWMAGPNQEALVYEYAMIPGNLTSGLDLGDVADIFTSMFMHAGLLHLGGNMLYLWIFGDNVEDSMGKGIYLLFYLVSGVVASLTHVLINPASQIPTVGASGAIAAVLGAYWWVCRRGCAGQVVWRSAQSGICSALGELGCFPHVSICTQVHVFYFTGRRLMAVSNAWRF